MQHWSPVQFMPLPEQLYDDPATHCEAPRTQHWVPVHAMFVPEQLYELPVVQTLPAVVPPLLLEEPDAPPLEELLPEVPLLLAVVPPEFLVEPGQKVSFSESSQVAARVWHTPSTHAAAEKLFAPREQLQHTGAHSSYVEHAPPAAVVPLRSRGLEGHAPFTCSFLAETVLFAGVLPDVPPPPLPGPVSTPPEEHAAASRKSVAADNVNTEGRERKEEVGFMMTVQEQPLCQRIVHARSDFSAKEARAEEHVIIGSHCCEPAGATSCVRREARLRASATLVHFTK
jgi:hypothetical protein